MIFGMYILLEPDFIFLLLSEVAGSAGMIALMPQDVLKRYESRGDILKYYLSDVVYRKPFKGVKSGKHDELIAKLETNDLVELMDEKPIVTNGVFGVPKQEKQMLIIDVRSAKEYFIDTDYPGLPSPGHFTALILEPDDKLFCAKPDHDDFYHRP